MKCTRLIFSTHTYNTPVCSKNDRVNVVTSISETMNKYSWCQVISSFQYSEIRENNSRIAEIYSTHEGNSLNWNCLKLEITKNLI